MGNFLSKALGMNSLNMNFNYNPTLANVPGMNFGNIANQMLTGQGSFMDAQRQAGAGQIQDAAYNAMNQQNMALAQRGIGSGSLRNLLDATSTAQAGEATSRFNLGLADRAFNQAGQFANLGLQQSLANQQAQNRATEFALTNEYNQAAANRAQRASLFGNVMTLAGGIGVQALRNTGLQNLMKAQSQQ